VSSAVDIVQHNASELAVGQIFVGNTLTTMFNPPGIPPSGDSRTPDLIVQPAERGLRARPLAVAGEHLLQTL
jgi:hypothetical protein